MFQHISQVLRKLTVENKNFRLYFLAAVTKNWTPGKKILVNIWINYKIK